MKITRMPHNPIITPNTPGLSRMDGYNINGPTLMKVPDWVENPLGKYYLFFAHHNGKYIRLAYSDKVEGPYTLYKPGILHLENTLFAAPHLASPEIFIDEANHTIRMYFHVGVRGMGEYWEQGQMTYLAISKDGLSFSVNYQQMAPFYLRVFEYQGNFYGLAKYDNIDGIIVRSPDGIIPFESGPHFIPHFRHCGVLRQNDLLHVVFSKAFTKPETLLYSTIDLSQDWMDWQFSTPIEVLKPELDWEGANLPITQSRYGGTKKAHALRDPFIYKENEEIHLFYTVMGEKGIAVAKIKF